MNCMGQLTLLCVIFILQLGGVSRCPGKLIKNVAKEALIFLVNHPPDLAKYAFRIFLSQKKGQPGRSVEEYFHLNN